MTVGFPKLWTAETFLEGQQVTLRTEPGVEKDSGGRLLRYVGTSTGDYGTLAVTYDHTQADDASRAVLRRVRSSYDGVRVTTTRRDRVGGRPALSTYGRATNRSGTELRFALVVVRAKPRNYGIASFTAAYSALSRKCCHEARASNGAAACAAVDAASSMQAMRAWRFTGDPPSWHHGAGP